MTDPHSLENPAQHLYSAGFNGKEIRELYEKYPSFKSKMDTYDSIQRQNEQKERVIQLKKHPSVTIDNKNKLWCPSCGSQHVHHFKTVKYSSDRHQVLSEECLKFGEEQKRPDLTIPTLKYHRNDNAISIHFWCEGCNAYPKLNIVQCEGQTIVEWDEDIS